MFGLEKGWRVIGAGVTIVFALVLACGQPEGDASGEPVTLQLFNGRDLDGWVPVLEEENTDPMKTWSVQDATLKCTGEPNGYIRTDRSFSDYFLVVEWRWPENPGNSGVLLHLQKGDKIWPYCIEAQLKAENAGDFYFMEGSKGTVEQARVNPERSINTKKLQAAENPPGEWNKYEITSIDGTLVLVVNGKLVNYAVDSEPRQGHIALQSEGAPIEFRTVELTPIRLN